MFDKLKRRLVVINMALLTTVFVCIFGTIYVLNTISINRQIHMNLQRIINEPFHPKPGDPMSASAIIINIDSQGEILKSNSYFNIESDEMKALVNKITNSSKAEGTIKIEGTTFAYLKIVGNSGGRIALMDKSSHMGMLLGLLKIFASVGGVTLVILYIVSVFLTNKTIKPIKEAFNKQKQFIADASHELKTPLTIINTNTSLIMSDLNDTVANNKKWIDYITLQTERMTQLINEMLSLAKLDLDNNIIYSEINLSKLIEHMVLSFEAIIFEGGFQFKEKIEDNIMINGSEENLKKLFSILMDNGIKHTNKNGEIAVELYTERNKVKLKITNTGSGIEEYELEKIFERFYRVDSSRNRETGGYGLGLAIANSIVDQHKGKIYAKSKVGQWTTFIVELPL